ncbi:hypothetical protein N483_00960 [Pseudoalteromonas luteoviolacea NCIMB 1944]|nr:hypothetical protein N483_00960 [Pseudoalteromonas luteoviolacea NCIMB 1944]
MGDYQNNIGLGFQIKVQKYSQIEESIKIRVALFKLKLL